MLRSLLEVVLLATGWLLARGRWSPVRLARFIELATQTVMVELIFSRCTLKLFIKKSAQNIWNLYIDIKRGVPAQKWPKKTVTGHLCEVVIAIIRFFVHFSPNFR